MLPGPRLKPLTVGPEDQVQLSAWSRRRKTAQGLAVRARIVLLASHGVSNSDIPRTGRSATRNLLSGTKPPTKSSIPLRASVCEF
jgi:hypothetical protein